MCYTTEKQLPTGIQFITNVRQDITTCLQDKNIEVDEIAGQWNQSQETAFCGKGKTNKQRFAKTIEARQNTSTEQRSVRRG